MPAMAENSIAVTAQDSYVTRSRDSLTSEALEKEHPCAFCACVYCLKSEIVEIERDPASTDVKPPQTH